MSVKLYNGLRVVDPQTDIFELTPKIAGAVRPVFEEAARKLVAEELLRLVDNSGELNPERMDRPILADLERDWSKRQQELGSHHYLNDPLRFSMVFGRSSKGNFLAYSYYTEPAYGEALRSLGIFEDYHYQDQTDEPDGFSRKEWKARGKEWDSLENSEGTFGDLPSWNLDRTQDPFSALYFGNRTDEFDPNSYTTPRARLKEIVTSRLFSYAREELRVSSAALIPLYSRTRSVVGRYLRDEENSSALSVPELLPLGIDTTYEDLPEPYRVDVVAFLALFERLKANIDGD